MQSDFGPDLDLASIVNPYRKILEDTVSLVQDAYQAFQGRMKGPWSKRSCEIRIIDAEYFNARAKLQGDSDRIEICCGLIECIFGAMWGLMSVPSFLPSIGNPKVEVQPAVRVDARFPILPMLRENDHLTRVETLIPNDPQRILFAGMLSEAAIEFVLYHELGHVIGGHLELAPTFACKSFDQADADDAHDDLFSQVLECDADAFAGNLLSRLHLDSGLAQLGYNLIQPTAWAPLEMAMLTFVTSVYVLFKLMNRSGEECYASADGSHPHEAVRCGFIIITTFARAAFGQHLSLSSLNRLCESAILNVEQTWDLMNFPRRRSQSPVDWATSVTNESKRLFNALEERRGRLDQHSRIRREWCDWEKGGLLS